MSIQNTTSVQLTAKLTEISELLEDMIVELEIRGCEKHHELVKRALLMQQQLEKLQEN